MATTRAADIRLGLKVWIAVGGPVFSVALVAMGWDYLHLKLQDATRHAAQSAVVDAAVPVARLSPPWDRIAVPAYPVGAIVRPVSPFSYVSPFKDVHNASYANVSDGALEDALLMRPKSSVRRGRHAQP